MGLGKPNREEAADQAAFLFGLMKNQANRYSAILGGLYFGLLLFDFWVWTHVPSGVEDGSFTLSFKIFFVPFLIVFYAKAFQFRGNISAAFARARYKQAASAPFALILFPLLISGVLALLSGGPIDAANYYFGQHTPYEVLGKVYERNQYAVKGGRNYVLLVHDQSGVARRFFVISRLFENVKVGDSCHFRLIEGGLGILYMNGSISTYASCSAARSSP